MKKFIVIALLAAALAGCDDFPFRDEGHFPGRGWGHEHGDDFAGKAHSAHANAY